MLQSAGELILLVELNDQQVAGGEQTNSPE